MAHFISTSSLMSAVEIKAQINKYLDQVDDSFLKVVHSMLDTYVKVKEDPIIGYSLEGKPLHASEAKEQYEKDIKGIKNKSYSTNIDLRKKAQKWLNPTK